MIAELLRKALTCVPKELAADHLIQYPATELSVCGAQQTQEDVQDAP